MELDNGTTRDGPAISMPARYERGLAGASVLARCTVVIMLFDLAQHVMLSACCYQFYSTYGIVHAAHESIYRPCRWAEGPSAHQHAGHNRSSMTRGKRPFAPMTWGKRPFAPGQVTISVRKLRYSIRPPPGLENQHIPSRICGVAGAGTRGGAVSRTAAQADAVKRGVAARQRQTLPRRQGSRRRRR